MTAKRRHGLTSEAQIVANRLNAQRSTGPRTRAGRQRSAANAFVHGLFAESGMAISHGPFAETPAEVETFIDGVVDALGPRDFIEEVAARQVGIAAWRQYRLARMEPSLLGGDARFDELARQLGLGGSEAHHTRARYADRFLEWLDGEDIAQQFPPHLILVFLYRERGVALPADAARWGDGTVPDEEWAMVLDDTIAQLWGGDRGEATRWAYAVRFAAMSEGDRLHTKEAEVVARRAVGGSMAQIAALSARLDPQVDRALNRYQMLQSRVLPLGAPADPPMGGSDHETSSDMATDQQEG